MIAVQLSNTTARKLSYLIGRSDEANTVVEAAMNASKVAEQNVRDIIKLVTDQAGHKLPETYTVEFKEELNELRIMPRDSNLVNGVNHE